MRLRLAVFLVAVAASTALVPARAAADETEVEGEAGRLKDAGDRAMAEHRYLDALGLYDRAYAASSQRAESRSAAVLFNRGRALEALGRYPDALDSFERFDREASPEIRGKVPKMDEILSATRARVATLTVRVTPDGARVMLGGVELGVSPLAPVRVNAGAATLEVSAEGHDTERRELVLRGGAPTTVEITLRPREHKLAIAPLPPARERPPDAPASPAITSRWWFWASVGTVVVAGGVVTVLALTTEKDPAPGSYPPGVLRAPLLRF